MTREIIYSHLADDYFDPLIPRTLALEERLHALVLKQEGVLAGIKPVVSNLHIPPRSGTLKLHGVGGVVVAPGENDSIVVVDRV